jgi:hypothetical protein
MNYLSPTSIKTYLANKDEFYFKYLAAQRPPRLAQTMPMAVGSAFDAELKKFLTGRLFGTEVDLFEQQVEPQNRDKARPIGREIMERYRESGGLGNLLRLLEIAEYSPRFELEIRGQHKGVPLLCKPDLYFVRKLSDGSLITVVVDFKVNGYFSTASPVAGYINIAPGNTPHRDAILSMHEGVVYNAATMDTYSEEWALQNTIAGWVLESDFMAGIEQLSFRGGVMRVSTYRGFVSSTYQDYLSKLILEIWNYKPERPDLDAIIENTKGANEDYYRSVLNTSHWKG